MLQLVPTADGSMTLFSPRFNQWYHSLLGALEESRRVYLELGFEYLAQRRGRDEKQPIRLLEMGFGTGLNALLTERASEAHRVPVHYTALEPYPIAPEMVGSLRFGEIADSPVWPQIHELPAEVEHALSATFTLLKRQVTLEAFLTETGTLPFDLVYYDAFAPSSQPELWTAQCFTRVADCMTPDGVLTTYCTKGIVNRALRAAGFRLEKHPGPGRKREVVRALKK